MDTETKFVGDREVARVLLGHNQEQLAAGVAAADMAFCLAYMSLDLAFHTAPSPADALTLVTSALSHASSAHCSAAADPADPGDVSDVSADASPGMNTGLDDTGPVTIH